MDPSSALLWNVRGLNGTARQDVLRKMVEETGMEEITRLDLLCLLDPEFDSFIFLPSVGSSGGVFL
jgi:hypothetical protein